MLIDIAAPGFRKVWPYSFTLRPLSSISRFSKITALMTFPYGDISDGPTEVGGISREEFIEGFKELHKDLAELSTNGRHVIVNGTDHISIVRNDETADHILSLIPNIES